MQRQETTQSDYLQQLRQEIDAALDSFSRFSDDSPKRLTDAVRYSLLAPGKRFRPTLTLLAAELCGDVAARKNAIPAAVALEAIHSYSLIHDDLPAMDDDDLRRGRPTCHRRFDEATAILAGDALLTFAFETLAANVSDPKIAARCVAELARAAGPCGMVGGQADDVLWSKTAEKTPGAFALVEEILNASTNGSERSEPALLPFLRKIHRRKTGALVVAAVRLGAIIGGATPLQLARLDAFARELGLAFQISDDVLDATGTEAEMGKRVQKDQDAGKLTYTTLLGVEKSRELLAATIVRAKTALSPGFVPELDGTDAAPASSPIFEVASRSWNALTFFADNLAERRK